MQPFWRPDPLNEQEEQLWNAVMAAHDKSARRQNISSSTVINAAAGSGDFYKSIAAGMLTLGGLHGPVEQAWWLLAHADPLGFVDQELKAGRRVVGWGNSFVKGKPDPDWAEVDRVLAEDWPALHNTIAGITEALHQAGKTIRPNPSIYTAALAHAVKMPPKIAPFIFLTARLPAWTALYANTVYG